MNTPSTVLGERVHKTANIVFQIAKAEVVRRTRKENTLFQICMSKFPKRR
jgi:hypothetical protein